MGKINPPQNDKNYFVHDSAYVDQPCIISDGTKIWHFSHVMKNARIDRNGILGQNVHIANDVALGDNVKIQNNVSVYTGCVIEDDVFLGPSCVLTNVTNPRSKIIRHDLYEKTLIRRGASIGANATLVCGNTIGQYAFIAAGAVVMRDVPNYALMIETSARRAGWMSRHGFTLPAPNQEGIMVYPEVALDKDVLRCMDWPEEKSLEI
jgi:UDP-2-acetamido-3-amino-2,3-dideoxy-glucuronate N-acetyltransferase